MEIIQATAEHFRDVRRITRETITAIYPRYYPAGAVQFFLDHHSDERIQADIASGKVYLLCADGAAAGTVTVSGNDLRGKLVDRILQLLDLRHVADSTRKDTVEDDTHSGDTQYVARPKEQEKLLSHAKQWF